MCRVSQTVVPPPMHIERDARKKYLCGSVRPLRFFTFCLTAALRKVRI